MATRKVQVPWSKIDTLLLDMDGTLLDLAFDNFFWLELVPDVYAKANGIPVEASRDALFSRYQAVAGTLPWYCLDHWSDTLGIDIGALKREHGHRIRYLPGACAFLERARGLGKRLILVTNAHRLTLRIKCERTGVDGLVDSVVSSHDYGVEKERGAFWAELERREDIVPGRALLLEDNLAVLATARRAGIGHAIAIRRPDTTQSPRDINEFPSVDGVGSLLG